MIICEEFKANINEYLDSELDSKLLPGFLEHLEDCNTCKIELEETRKIISIIKEIPEVELPFDFKEKLHLKLINEKQKFDKKNNFYLIKNRYFKIFSSIAAILVIAVLLKGIFLKQSVNTKSSNISYAPFAASVPDKGGAENQKAKLGGIETPEATSGGTGENDGVSKGSNKDVVKSNDKDTVKNNNKDVTKSTDKDIEKSTNDDISGSSKKVIPEARIYKTETTLADGASTVQGERFITIREITLEVENPNNEIEKVSSKLLENGARLSANIEVKPTIKANLNAAIATDTKKIQVEFIIRNSDYSKLLEVLTSTWGKDAIAIKEIPSKNKKEEIDQLNSKILELNDQIKSYEKSGEENSKLDELNLQKNEILAEISDFEKGIDYTIASIIVEAK
jgi:hypothetical protein